MRSFPTCLIESLYPAQKEEVFSHSFAARGLSFRPKMCVQRHSPKHSAAREKGNLVRSSIYFKDK